MIFNKTKSELYTELIELKKNNLELLEKFAKLSSNYGIIISRIEKLEKLSEKTALTTEDLTKLSNKLIVDAKRSQAISNNEPDEDSDDVYETSLFSGSI